jgi:hypothetical protein
VLAKSKRTLVKTTTAAIIDSGGSGAEQGGEWRRVDAGCEEEPGGWDSTAEGEEGWSECAEHIDQDRWGWGRYGSVEFEGLYGMKIGEHGI